MFGKVILLLIHFIFAGWNITAAFAEDQVEKGSNAQAFYELISTCAAGAEIQISADMEGSLKDFFSGQNFQGQGSILTQTQWLQLFAEEDRIEAAGLYHACIKDILKMIIDEKDKQTRNNKAAYITNNFAFFCSPSTNNEVTVLLDNSVVPNSPDIGKVFFDFKVLLDRFYIGKDMNLYTDGLGVNTFVGHNLKSPSEVKAQREAYDSSGITEKVYLLIYYSYEPVKTIGQGQKTVERTFIFFLDFNAQFIAFLREVYLDDNGQRHALIIRKLVATCTRDLSAGLEPPVVTGDKRVEDQGTAAPTEAGNLCDRLAGNEYDLRRNLNFSAVPYRLLAVHAAQAIDACRIAAQSEPQELRYSYQLARSLQTQRSPEAKELLTKLVVAGYPAAHDNLGWVYYNQGNVREAVELFKKGAMLDDVESMVSYARLLLGGKWVARDVDLAYRYFQIAAARGHPDAEAAIQELERGQRARELGVTIFGAILRGIIAKDR